MNKRDMNLLERYRYEQKLKKSKTSPILAYTGIIIVALLVLGAYGAKLFLDKLNLDALIQSERAFVESPAVVQQLQEINKIKEDLEDLVAIEEQIAEINTVLGQTARFDSKVMGVLYYERQKGISFNKIEYENNTVTIEFTGKSPSDASNFKLRLERTKAFGEVTYHNFEYDSDKKLYTGEMQIVLKGGY